MPDRGPKASGSLPPPAAGFQPADPQGGQEPGLGDGADRQELEESGEALGQRQAPQALDQRQGRLRRCSEHVRRVRPAARCQQVHADEASRAAGVLQGRPVVARHREETGVFVVGARAQAVLLSNYSTKFFFSFKLMRRCSMTRVPS